MNTKIFQNIDVTLSWHDIVGYKQPQKLSHVFYNPGKIPLSLIAAYLEPCCTSTTELFEKVVNDF